MSLSSSKEILRPCAQQSQCSSSYSPIANPRKPPKSCLSQQLLRLEPLPLPGKQLKHLKEIEEEDASPRFDPTGPYEPLLLSTSVQVPASINCRLLKHQREGVKFLYNLYKSNCGGILGDDMGLGKTIQAIAFLSAVYGKDDKTTPPPKAKGPTLIICPSSVIQNWESEFSKWSTFHVAIYHGTNRDIIFEKIQSHGVEILITSFDTYRIHEKNLSQTINWEIVIVDEAHRLKNEKSKLYEACLAIETRNRYGLTGTIMQNKIMELFNLFDWVVPGGLGSREHFRDYYEEPLKHGQRSSAPERFVEIAQERKQHLVSVLHKYLLRRTKEETIGHLMMGKEDNVVFCAMSEVQKRVYRRMLQIPDIQCLINKDVPCSCGSPLKQVECCKRTVPDGVIWPYLHKDNPDGCDSCPFCLVLPCLTKLQQISNHLELIKPNSKDDPDKQEKDMAFASQVFGSDIDVVGGYTQNESFMGLSDVEHCGKMRALEKLMSSWILHDDKILLFSYSVRMLDILEKFLIRKGYDFSRLDGSTPTGMRQSLVDNFNSSPSKQVFLISTRAGGLGLNLVSANRVVIFDPNWNPAHDLQAQDRSFRFGQKRHVVVFRLLAAGSLEELVYSRQVYKQQLSNIAVSGKLEKRYFEGVQDCKEFQGELFGISNLFRDLSDKLFTSEIIQSYDRQGTTTHEHGHEGASGEQDMMSDLGMCFLPPQARDKSELFSSKESNKRIAPLNQDLGIVYAHRNEDIISHKRGCDVDVMQEVPTGIHSCLPQHVPKKKHGEKANASLRRAHKIKQYRRLATFMGMQVVEFSKWFLSASLVEREQVLRNYKRRRAVVCL
ncbi:putative DNA helicase chromatin remodeling SNF2 family [Helianthus debilis subsp. tardiflorus]